MAEGRTWKPNGIAFRILFLLEKLQLKKANEVICANAGMISYSQKVYGIQKKRYFVKPACVNLELFSMNNIKNEELMNELDLRGKVTCVYAGKFGGLYLEQEVFDLLKVAADHWGEKFRVLLLTNHSDEEISKYASVSKLDKKYIVKRFVPHRKIPDYLGVADFALCPMKPLPSRRYAAPIKNAEYWALGLPVIITKDISDDSELINNNNAGYVLSELNNNEYKRAIIKIDELLIEKNRQELYSMIRPIAEIKRNFTIAKEVYSKIYGRN
jgi:glycosyltransferase involved in cell wall biosynthesis